MQRKRILSVCLLLLLLLFSKNIGFAQDKKISAADELLKENIYNENRKKVINFSMKEFDALFLEFFNKKLDQHIVLTKEEFYTYTVQIATFSDRLALLYPKQKGIAEENKKKWMSETYEDYLAFKESQKK